MVQIGRVKRTAVCQTRGELAIGLVRQVTELSQNRARRLFELGTVYVNGELCLDWRRTLNHNDELSIDTDRKAPRRLPTFDLSRVVHVDHSFMVVDKPANIVSVPPTPTGEPTLLDLLSKAYPETRERGTVVPLHRLDRETRGLMLFGFSNGRTAQLLEQFRQHKITRCYYAIVDGDFTLTRLAGEIDVSRVAYGGTRQKRYAETAFETVQRGRRSLIICRPYTGRYHQLRIQLADAGHPIIGDQVHGPPSTGRSPLGLQSFSLHLTRPEDGEPLTWQIDLDPELAAMLQPLEQP
jgi:23S rRNA pseudouridine1911/1915/1917 synthase